jgi:hypothetical protein
MCKFFDIFWRAMLEGKYIVNWSFSVSLRLFSGAYEGKYILLIKIVNH